MDMEEVIKGLWIKNDKKILLIVMDGIGGLPVVDGKTELEAAHTPNLDELASKSVLGFSHPVSRGITPGSGPGHLGIFGYDPLKYEIGRGILEALGVGVDVNDKDVAVRGNFATIKGGKIVDRRAGRIPTEENKRICAYLSEKIKEIDGIEVFIYPGEEHRFVLILRGDGLYDEVEDADPQETGLPPKPARATDPRSELTARIANKFIEKVTELLKDRHPANTVLLRGFARHPHLPSMEELYGLKALGVADYPMYRGLAKLVGMDVPHIEHGLDNEIRLFKEMWGKYDFVYFHLKKTDSYGEDGNFQKKISLIEEFDSKLPEILSVKPDVVAITGDHSTPSLLKAHSWHPVPLLLYSPYIRPDTTTRFTEYEAAKGGLGHLYAKEILPLLLANALRLKKFGA